MTNVTKNKAPKYIAYSIREGKDKGYFNRIGMAWPNADGKGFNIQLDVVPLDGRITLRLLDENNA